MQYACGSLVCTPDSKLGQMAHDRNAERQSLILPRGPLLAVTPEVHCLDVLRVVVSPRPSHSSRINVIGHDVAIVRERPLTDGALPVLFDNFSIKQLPHLCFGAEFAISPGVVRVFDTLHSELSDSSSLLNRFAATARERSMNRTILIATEFHGFPPVCFSGRKRDVRFPVCLRTDHIPFDPLNDFSCALVNWRMCAAC